jgi:small subunit ribosomal protein S4
MAEDDVKVEVTSNVLTICGESQPSEANMHNKVQLKEWRSSFVLPAGTDPEQIHAEYSSGILTVTARKPPQVSLEAHRQSEPLPRAARKMVTGYGLQLREKQKTKRIYFTLENQFRNYFEKAAHKPGVTGELLLQQLERRLDNVVYRLGFAISRGQARQLVRHGHVEVNGRRVNIPSYQVSAGDEIQVREKARKFVTVEGAREYSSRQPVVNWLAVDRDNFKGRVLSLPKREDTGNTVPQWNVSKREETSG